MSHYNAKQTEEEVLEFWKNNNIFNKSLKLREGAELFSFYDGPPFANGLPHFGHSLVTSIKDAMLRYKTMRGYYVPRRNGWDCHGLPVEFAIEKQLGISGKKQILELGIDKFNNACRDSIFTYKTDWEAFMQRIGRWSEYDNYYATVDTSYTESVWWVIAQVHKKDLLYRGYKSVPYCPRCATPLSNFELNEGYQDNVEDPSLYVTFQLKNDKRKMLAWTTTPWSLAGNTALAVSPEEMYVTVEIKNDKGEVEQLVLGEKRLEVLQDDYKIITKEKGSELVGKQYEPVFKVNKDLIRDYPNVYQIWASDFVSIEDGSGVLHVAPAYGEDDLNLGQEHNLPIIHNLGEDGKLLEGFGHDELAGKFFKGADEPITEILSQRGQVFAAEKFNHTYPFCYRCESPLLYYAISSWFVKVTAIKDELVEVADDIHWVPGNIKSGRFGKWLEGARDWAISRNRYWGAPMPIWQNTQDKEDYIVIGSIAELKELAGDDIKVDDLHRPYIDDITFERDGKTYKRIEEVLDCWFESGSMSVAQQHYPFDNTDKFEHTFPADFIIEGLDQTRLWFYVQHVVAAILFGKPAFKNAIVNGMIMASDGQKLSKRLKNYPPLEDVFEHEGADILRLYLLSSPQATETADYMRFDRDGMRDMQRNVIGTLWNTYTFYKMYADIDGWKPNNNSEPSMSENALDVWIIARLNETITASTKSADNYKIAHTLEPIFELIDDMSNWYVRRSRRRFWKSDNDSDKQSAYQTLHHVLVSIVRLLAPWAPFISEHLYQELKSENMPESVHLNDWPIALPVNQLILDEMSVVRQAVNDGLSQRAELNIKVRQPLSRATVMTSNELSNGLQSIIAEELNVKKVVVKKAETLKVELDTNITQDLKNEGLAREIIRNIQQARKDAGLDVENHLELVLQCQSDELLAAIKQCENLIKNEVLATTLTINSKVFDYQKDIKIESFELTISLAKCDNAK